MLKQNKFFGLLSELAEFGIYAIKIIKVSPSIIRYRAEFLRQIIKIGIDAFPIITITGFFMGAITGIQLGAAMNYVINESAFLISGGIILALVREMIPVLTALVVVSRICSSIAAEIGSMVVTEQIDALKVMSVSPEEFIAVPRILTTIVTVPILGTFAIIVSIIGAWLTMLFVHHVPTYSFFTDGLSILTLRFYMEAFFKLMIFGWILSTIATFYGFRTEGGSVGVGQSTVKAVVVGTFATILLDYIVGTFFLLL
ncbi:MAG: MlaE family ABC transporter permease [Brevinemataceae bacterium]